MTCPIYKITALADNEDWIVQYNGEMSRKRRRIGDDENLLEDNLPSFAECMSATEAGEDSQLDEFLCCISPSERDDEDRHYLADESHRIREQLGNTFGPSDIVHDKANHILPGHSETVKMTSTDFKGSETTKDSVVLCNMESVRFSAIGTSKAPSNISIDEVGEGEGEGKKEVKEGERGMLGEKELEKAIGKEEERASRVKGERAKFSACVTVADNVSGNGSSDGSFDVADFLYTQRGPVQDITNLLNVSSRWKCLNANLDITSEVSKVVTRGGIQKRKRSLASYREAPFSSTVFGEAVDFTSSLQGPKVNSQEVSTIQSTEGQTGLPKTASVKPVFQPSASLLQRPKVNFQEVSAAQFTQGQKLSKTASENPVCQPSVESLRRANTLLEDSIIYPATDNEALSVFFTTDSGESTEKPYATSLGRAANLMVDINKNSEIPVDEERMSCLAVVLPNEGQEDDQTSLVTASGKPVLQSSVSSFQRAKALLGSPLSCPELETDGQGGLFTMASGKAVQPVTAMSVQKARVLSGERLSTSSNPADSGELTYAIGASLTTTLLENNQSGFLTTASGKPVRFSSVSSIERAQLLLNGSSNSLITENECQTALFSTAPGKPVQAVCSTSLEKAMVLLNEPFNSSASAMGKLHTSSITAEPTEQLIASTRSINQQPREKGSISQQANAKSLFGENKSGTSCEGPNLRRLVPDLALFQRGSETDRREDCNMDMFKTASGKSVSLSSTAALAKAKSLLGEDKSCSLSEGPNVGCLNPEALSNDLALFKRGIETDRGEDCNMDIGKSVSLSSTAALAKAKLLFGENKSGSLPEGPSVGCLVPEILGNDLELFQRGSETDRGENCNMDMFKTASGKSVSLSSAAALAKANSLFGENKSGFLFERQNVGCLVPEILGNDLELFQRGSETDKCTDCNMDIFKTASGKMVSLSSTAALAKAKSLFVEDKSCSLSEGPNVGSLVPETLGNDLALFQTGTGKAVIVSEDSHDRAKALLSGETTSCEFTHSKQHNIHASPGDPFSFPATPMVSTVPRYSGEAGDDIRSLEEIDINSSFQGVSPGGQSERISNPGIDFLRSKKIGLSIESSKENHDDFRRAGAELRSSRKVLGPLENASISNRSKKIRFSSPRLLVESPLHPMVTSNGGFPPPSPKSAPISSCNGTFNFFQPPQLSIPTKGKQRRTEGLPPIPMQTLVPTTQRRKNLHNLYREMTNRQTLDDFFEEPPGQDCAISLLPEKVRVMTADTAKLFTITEPASQGMENTSNSLGHQELRRVLIEEGADPKSATEGWVENHYRWIVWKLACYERRFPRRFANQLLTKENILDQLKYRYEREINNGNRPVIRKITEKDVIAGQPMVLCISAIRSRGWDPRVFSSSRGGDPDHREAGNGPSGQENEGNEGTMSSGSVGGGKVELARIEVTDGWYCLPAQLDSILSRCLRDGKLFVGQKLMVYGAELLGSSEGLPPLEACRSMSLSLYVNGTHRVKWSTKLGSCKYPTPLAFRCIKGTEGPVPLTAFAIVRTYPVVYRERLPSGGGVIRSARAEEVASRAFKSRQAKLAEEVASRMENEGCLGIVNKKSKSRRSEGSRLASALETSGDPEGYFASLAPGEQSMLIAYRNEQQELVRREAEKAVQEALKEANLSSRDVTPMLRLRVAGLRKVSSIEVEDEDDSWGSDNTFLDGEGMVTVWAPSDEQLQDLMEGGKYIVLGLRLSVIRRESFITSRISHFSTSRGTKWQRLPPSSAKSLRCAYPKRKAVKLSELGTVPEDREFDISALVVNVGKPVSKGMKTSQWIFLVDGSRNEGSLEDSEDVEGLSLLAVEHNAFADAFMVLETTLVGCVVSWSNLLRKKPDAFHSLWVASASDIASLSTSPSGSSLSHFRETASEVSSWASSISNTMANALCERVREIIGMDQSEICNDLTTVKSRFSETRRIAETRRKTVFGGNHTTVKIPEDSPNTDKLHQTQNNLISNVVGQKNLSRPFHRKREFQHPKKLESHFDKVGSDGESSQEVSNSEKSMESNMESSKKTSPSSRNSGSSYYSKGKLKRNSQLHPFSIGTSTKPRLKNFDR